MARDIDHPPYPARPHQTPQLPLRHHPFPPPPPVMSSLLRAQSQLDEGFSEETRSQSDSDMYSALDGLSDAETATQKVLQSLLSLPAEQREYIISEGVMTLGSLAKGRIGKQIVTLTHFDPAHYLPNEVFLQIFSYLSPHDLLAASTISRDWRIRSQDERLWRGCFAREGWVLDTARIKAFEEWARRKQQDTAETSMDASVPSLQRKESRKRKTEEAFSGDEGPAGKARVTLGENSTTAPPSERVADKSRPADCDGAQDRMEGLEAASESDSEENTSTPTSEELTQHYLQQARAVNVPPSPAEFQVAPPMYRPGSGQTKLSWPYLYKQRRRLEANWENGFYTMFQLPHKDHPEEGHDECVYTIQHTARHLVSGSRDKTIRIWDLSTNRLKGKPLRGHDASVLCLQFDERPEHDIIVSGGSDAFVIIWKFSTGEIITKMTDAHAESVLNLRFDDRYIVTCSKDYTIKVWNRRELARDSPLIPLHVMHKFNDPAGADLASSIPAYTLLTSFIGHHAAVNAVMIHESTIVSASGDRTIKAWDLHTGNHKKSYNGHQKGIACVQFDGRRVVSGSSDNTVRIFDAAQQAEIACLSGHTNLVRTVQARFGDLETTTDAELFAQARDADNQFYRALAKGMQPATAARRGPRNAGSSRPEDMQSVGTKIPPGGGGTRWAKIVSGSYDETVIVWKRDMEGKWQVKLRLSQEQLLQTRSHLHRRRHHHAAAAHGHGAPLPGTATTNQAVTPAQVQAQYAHLLQQHQTQPAGAVPAPPSQLPTLSNAANQTNPQPGPSHTQQHQTTVTTTTAGPTTTFTATGPPTPYYSQLTPLPHSYAAASSHHPFTAAWLQQHPTGLPGPQPPGSVSPALQSMPPHLLAQLNAHASAQHARQVAAHQQQQSAAAAAATNPAQPAAAPAPTAAPAPALPALPAPGQQAAAAAGHARRPTNESNRVFKLQFDARRIVCCSQNRTIVGWDFANGDEELERIGEWSLETA